MVHALKVRMGIELFNVVYYSKRATTLGSDIQLTQVSAVHAAMSQILIQLRPKKHNLLSVKISAEIVQDIFSSVATHKRKQGHIYWD